MHRSGTSAVTRTLNHLGATLPADLMSAGPDNVQGFWESQSLMEKHEQVLGSAGASWSSFHSIPDWWYSSDTAAGLKRELRAFVESQFDPGELFVLKDPRMSLFVRIWLEILEEIRTEGLAVLVLRNPLDVAASLAKRNGFSQAHSSFLWLHYMLEAEAGTRSIRRSLVRFDALLAGWRDQVRRVFGDLDLPWGAPRPEAADAIDEFLSPAHRHHWATTEALQSDEIPDWVRESYRLLLRLEADPHDAEACRGLDEIRRQFRTATRLYLPLLDEVSVAAREAAEKSVGAESLREAVSALSKAQRRQAEDLREEVTTHLSGRISEVEGRLEEARSEALQLRRDLRSTRVARDKWLRESTRLAIALHSTRRNPFRLAGGRTRKLRALIKNGLKIVGFDLDSRRIYSLIAGSGLFDVDFYSEQLGGLDPRGVNLLRHFLSSGSLDGARPNPLFDTAYYLRTYHDVAEAGQDPLAHYIRCGAAEGRLPHPLFDTRFYLESYPDVAAASENPLAHYLRVGGVEARWPHPLFDPEFYRAEYPDVAEHNLNPLVHYLRYGADEPLRPNPDFDVPGYLKRHPEIIGSTTTPLAHFAEFGTWLAQREAARSPRVSVAGKPAEGRPTISWALLADADAVDRNAKVNHLLNGFAKVVSERPTVSVVIPVFNQLHHTVHCLWSLAQFRTEVPFEVIVVNDCSSDETREVLQLIPGLNVVDNEENSGFVVSCNNGAAAARGEYVVFLNNDTAVLDDWLDELVDVFHRFPTAGFVSSKLLYPDGSLQEAGCVVWDDGSAWNIGRDSDAARPEYNYLRDTHYGSGCSVMTPRKLFDELSGFDLEFKPGYYEDIDYAYRVRAAGRRVIYQPDSQLIHFEGRTGGTDLASGAKKYQLVNRERFKQRWAEVLTRQEPETTPVYKVDCEGASAHVLFIEPTTLTPDRDAGSAMSVNLIRALTRLRMKVTFVPSENFVRDSRYTPLLQREGVECLYRPYYESLADLFRERPDAWDYIFIARLHCISEVFDEVRRANPSAKLIYQTIDLTFVRERRELELGLLEGSEETVNLKEETELEYIKACDKSIIVSSFERELLAARGLGDKVASMPLLSYDYPSPELGDRQGIMFIGGFRHRPNVDAVRFLAEEIAPEVLEVDPSLVFYILGGDVPRDLLKLGSPNILFMGQIENPDSFFLSMRLSIAPLRYGAGIKGKVIQSIAAGLPCVGTALAAEGIGSAEETGLWLSETASDIAKGVLTLATDDQAWRTASEVGYRFARERYATEALTRDVEEFMHTLT